MPHSERRSLTLANKNKPGTTERLLRDVYSKFCEYAVKRFSDLYLPCSFENARGRCCNKRLGHSPKGHQNELGKLLAPGSFESDFQPQEFQAEWLNLIRRYLQRMEEKFFDQSRTHTHISSADIASSLHRDEINDFYKLAGGAENFLSHEICFSCLRELPEHALPCGHVLCNACVLAHGKKIAHTVIELERCPLHYAEYMWDPPWEIQVKPLHAGVRILCLDG